MSDNRNELAAVACTLCIEHSHVLRSAFGLYAPSTGSALLRLQYEALLRGVWLMFAATATQVEKIAGTLDVEAEQGAKNLPGYSEMLNAVLKGAPAGLTAPLAEFNQYSRHALNSFVHSGIHALHRTRHGYPREMEDIEQGLVADRNDEISNLQALCATCNRHKQGYEATTDGKSQSEG